MIIEAIFNLVIGALEIIFGWINLPQFPADLLTSITKLEDLMFSNLSVLSFFVRMSTVRIIIPLVIIIVNFDKIYRLTIFILRKIPFFSIE